MPDLNNLRILIADDHEIVRWGIRTLLSSRPGWIVCAEASTGREAVALAAEFRPHIVVMDISMPGLNGLDATRKIRKMLPETQILVLSIHCSDQLVRELAIAGVRAYVLKSDADRDLLSAVEALTNNRCFFTSGPAEILTHDFFKSRTSGAEPSAKLTAREREIVQLVAEGKTCKEAAVVLGISVKTAETHRSNVMCKLDIHSASELVRYAVRNSIIEP